jgi:hypothetical protein
VQTANETKPTVERWALLFLIRSTSYLVDDEKTADMLLCRTLRALLALCVQFEGDAGVCMSHQLLDHLHRFFL